ncbi:LOW QUALITY PROTEIN: hypothetical protein CVT26_008716 [Gymnopilus dilepis]|uniref:Uncharacterized protein n=1 Tax=Gymnopilus dilepis TaxID=231916 RepID=A0A409YGB6_9AGAR|nr:LOW QUALITY PROTEIN: hypothetical protein CVT26_008716 [Gymnopilus dilepis]
MSFQGDISIKLPLYKDLHRTDGRGASFAGNDFARFIVEFDVGNRGMDRRSTLEISKDIWCGLNETVVPKGMVAAGASFNSGERLILTIAPASAAKRFMDSDVQDRLRICLVNTLKLPIDNNLWIYSDSKWPRVVVAKVPVDLNSRTEEEVLKDLLGELASFNPLIQRTPGYVLARAGLLGSIERMQHNGYASVRIALANMSDAQKFVEQGAFLHGTCHRVRIPEPKMFGRSWNGYRSGEGSVSPWGSGSDVRGLATPEAGATPSQRHVKWMRRRKNEVGYEFKGSNGLVDLPKISNRTCIGLDLDPSVVISFPKEAFPLRLSATRSSQRGTRSSCSSPLLRHLSHTAILDPLDSSFIRRFSPFFSPALTRTPKKTSSLTTRPSYVSNELGRPVGRKECLGENSEEGEDGNVSATPSMMCSWTEVAWIFLPTPAADAVEPFATGPTQLPFHHAVAAHSNDAEIPKLSSDDIGESGFNSSTTSLTPGGSLAPSATGRKKNYRRNPFRPRTQLNPSGLAFQGQKVAHLFTTDIFMYSMPAFRLPAHCAGYPASDFSTVEVEFHNMDMTSKTTPILAHQIWRALQNMSIFRSGIIIAGAEFTCAPVTTLVITICPAIAIRRFIEPEVLEVLRKTLITILDGPKAAPMWVYENLFWPQVLIHRVPLHPSFHNERDAIEALLRDLISYNPVIQETPPQVLRRMHIVQHFNAALVTKGEATLCVSLSSEENVQRIVESGAFINGKRHKVSSSMNQFCRGKFGHD